MLKEYLMKPVVELTKDEAAKELAFLAAELAKADNAYYQNDDPYLSDADYDKLKHRNFDIEARFPELIRADSPSKKVGATVKSGFNKVSHRFPMLSLGDVFSGSSFPRSIRASSIESFRVFRVLSESVTVLVSFMISRLLFRFSMT